MSDQLLTPSNQPDQKAKWAVNIKGHWGGTSFEISVIREDFNHGLISYGWFGYNKLLITHNGGPCSWPVTQRVWDRLVQVAIETAMELNKEEFNIDEAVKVFKEKTWGGMVESLSTEIKKLTIGANNANHP